MTAERFAKILPLESGDRLSRVEFERRYHAMPHLKKAEQLRVYRRNGVQEYVVWRTYSQQIDWFYLQDGEYQSLTTDEQGIFRSRQFPGLWLASEALLSGNLGEVLRVLGQGISSPEHGEFVASL